MNSINIKEKLADARNIIFGMPEMVYQFAEYLASTMNNDLTPEGVTMAIALAFADIKSEDAKIADRYPELVKSVKLFGFYEAQFILQIIDEITNEEFDDAVRTTCKEVLGWNPVKRAGIKDRKNFQKCFPPCVVAATDWWTTKMQLSDKAKRSLAQKASFEEFTEEEVTNFSWALATAVNEKLDQRQWAVLYHHVFGNMNSAFAKGVETLIESHPKVRSFLSNACMIITPKTIELDYESGEVIIWQAE